MASLDKLLGAQEAQLMSAQIDGSRLQVTWADGSGSQFPLLMLRDCCTCEKCFSPTVNSRLTLFEQLLGTNCEARESTIEDGKLRIEWQDGHSSAYEAEWLYKRRLEPDAIQDRLGKVYTNAVDTPWATSDPAEIIKSRRYDDIVGNPEAVVDLVESLIRDGVFLIEGAPDRECLAEFLRDIHCLHAGTHYGAENWVIKNNPDSKDLPNSCKKLELHIDMPYLSKPCQLQLLHCLVQAADGGENKLSDALKAALILKERSPDDYKLLSTVEVDFQFIKNYGDKTWFICNRAPVIQEDPRTNLPTLCRFAAEVRCSSFNQPVEVVEAWFEAFRRYWAILEENAIFNKAKPGDILVFNNGRVMHARELFDTRQRREMEGIYADWDYLLSAWRVAKIKLAAAGAES